MERSGEPRRVSAVSEPMGVGSGVDQIETNECMDDSCVRHEWIESP